MSGYPKDLGQLTNYEDHINKISYYYEYDSAGNIVLRTDGIEKKSLTEVRLFFAFMLLIAISS